MRILLLLAAATLVSAQTATVPVAGVVLTPEGKLASVAGVLQNLMPGTPFGAYDPVISASFADAGGVVKTASQLLITNAAGKVQSRRAAPAGNALFGLGQDGSVSWVYFSGSAQIESVDGSRSFSTAGLGDAVVALGAENSQGLTVLARTGSQLWAETAAVDTGAALAQVPVAGMEPAIFFEGGWLVTSGTGLAWGSQTFLTPSPVTSLQTAGPHAVAINGQWLLNSAWKVLEIPSAPRSVPRIALPGPAGARR